MSSVNSGKNCSLEYLGSDNISPKLKSSEQIQSFPFVPGDELLYIGYLASYQSGVLDDPVNSQFYTFQFAYNIPCPGIPSITYEGKVYNTVQIFSQCWLKENLDIGIMIQGSEQSTNNGIIEKYCFNDDTNRCIAHGGLYRWNELMNYTIQKGAQGICPSGWHVPTNEEMNLLEGVADSQYGIGDPIWETVYYRGFDVGTNLKSISGWGSSGNGTDLYGFSALPGGQYYEPNFGDDYGCFWTSSDVSNDNAWAHAVNWWELVTRQYVDREGGFSVRCLKNIE